MSDLKTAAREFEAALNKTAAKNLDPARAIVREVSDRKKKIEGLQKEIADLGTLRSEWTTSPKKLIPFGLATESQIDSWRKPIDAFQKMVTQNKVPVQAVRDLQRIESGPYKMMGVMTDPAMQAAELRQSWTKKLIKSLGHDDRYVEGAEAVELTAEARSSSEP